MDIVALAKFQQQDYSFLIHVENESSSKTDFNQRLFRYFCSLFLRYNRAQCLRLLVTLKLDPAKMQLISGFVDSYLRLNSNEEALFQSELGTMETREQEQIMQITTSWKEEGRVEGRIEEKLAITLRQLNRKLGNLPEAITDQIKSLEPIQLDSLTEDLLDFQSLGDLQNWLSNS